MSRDLHPSRSLGACVALTILLGGDSGAQLAASAGRIAADAAGRSAVRAPAKPTLEQFMAAASPLELTSAKKADRVAWTVYDRGMRNVYSAGAPTFKPVRLTSFLKDDGVDVTGVKLSDDGSMAVFIRGSAANGDGWVANPSHDPMGGDRAIWAVPTNGTGVAHRIAAYAAFEVSPDGRYVVYVRDGQIYRAKTSGVMLDSIDRGEKPFIRQWGRNSAPRWSPDGSKIAFASDRTTHAFIGMYDMVKKTVEFIAPSVDRDAAPMWIDARHIMFQRRPGTPFGLQSTPGGGTGLPDLPAGRGGRGGARAGGGGANAVGQADNTPNICGTGGAGRGGRGGADSAISPAGATGARGGRGGRGGADSVPTAPPIAMNTIPGMCNATFRGGYTAAVVIADIKTHELKEVWRNTPQTAAADAGGGGGGGGGGRAGRGGGGGGGGLNLNGARLAGNHFLMAMQTNAQDEWERYGSVALDGTNSQQLTLLTTTDGMIEDNTSVALSADGKTLYYCTNAGDIERRHIWAVPVAGGTPPRQVSTGDGIETYPQPLASGKSVAVIYFNWNQPASIALVPAEGGKPKIIFSGYGPQFPVSAHVKPEIIITKAADGVEVHNQLFLPADLKPGEKRPTMVFLHGGPARQMMPGYHYFQFYHWAYGINQYLASQGYIVMSINYRSGVGYGRSFRTAPRTGARGNSEYQDVLAGAHYLRARADVDPQRLGIWGLSYGGQLTAEALARNSDIFVAGVDFAGVHVLGGSLESNSVAYQSSAVGHIDKWKSPVFLVHGDDDRNVNFGQTIGLVQLLRQRDVYYELQVVPDDLHESMLHSVWTDTWNRMDRFVDRFVERRETPPKMPNGLGG